MSVENMRKKLFINPSLKLSESDTKKCHIVESHAEYVCLKHLMSHIFNHTCSKRCFVTTKMCHLSAILNHDPLIILQHTTHTYI